jgi:arthrofactin-type cyclic lipopeptide synthetase C
VDAGTQQLTYAELGARAERLARHLRNCGVVTGSMVALALDDPVSLIIGMAGTLMAGGLYVAVDRDLPESRVVQLVHDCAPAAMIVRAPAPWLSRVAADPRSP